jgi:hypothetical protein
MSSEDDERLIISMRKSGNNSAGVAFQEDSLDLPFAGLEGPGYQRQIMIKVDSLLACEWYLGLDFQRGLGQHECMGNDKASVEAHRNCRGVKACVVRRR